MSFARRLTMTVVVASLVTALVLGIGALLSTRALFDRYVQQAASGRQQLVVDTLSQFYQGEGSWEGVEPVLDRLFAAGPGGRMTDGRAPADVGGGMRPGIGRWGTPAGLSGSWSWALLDADKSLIARPTAVPLDPETGLPSGLGRPVSLPIRVNGQVAGYLLMSGEMSSVLGALEGEFQRSVWLWLTVSALVALGVGALAGWFSSGALRRRAAHLTDAAAALGSRQFHARVPEEGQDELGLVARAFNRMAAELGRSETARRHLLADVAHELRTPLAVLRGQLEMLEDGVVEPTTATFRTLHDDALRLTRLVSDLEQLSLAEAGRLNLRWREFRPETWLAQELEVFRSAATERGVALEEDVSDLLPEQAEGDPDRLGQVLTNLLSNALRHTPRGGSILVSAGPAEGGWAFHVRDSGEGIAAEDLPHVFDRFYRAPRPQSPAEPGGRASANGPQGKGTPASELVEERRGSGLGLAIVRGLVNAHGGRVWAESALGRGSTFHVWLPLRRPRAEETAWPT